MRLLICLSLLVVAFGAPVADEAAVEAPAETPAEVPAERPVEEVEIKAKPIDQPALTAVDPLPTTTIKDLPELPPIGESANEEGVPFDEELFVLFSVFADPSETVLVSGKNELPVIVALGPGGTAALSPDPAPPAPPGSPAPPRAPAVAPDSAAAPQHAEPLHLEGAAVFVRWAD